MSTSKNKKNDGANSKTPAIAAVVFGIFVVAAAAWLWMGSRTPGSSDTASAASPSAPAAASSGTAAPALAGRAYPSQGHAHLNPDERDDFVYNSNPPTSGPHKEIFTDQFIMPTPLPVYIQVHLLEHGNVLLQYNCSCPDIAASLSSIAYEYDSKLIAPNELQPTQAEVQAAEEQGRAVIVAPYPKMKAKIALTAWTHLATVKSSDKQRIESFINLYLTNEANASQ